ncbi:O-methylsterigmatocystin oxidoreductase [Grifola frondosa]|uniref:O-methylsterigmatocystin oxidoreductase n=1 Tax=Grifola frondosa TaxID=5627 RepID=A0A1C7MH54_GRIFR|nr:O-methylsterigmatocystin oxidoreductase [Grifola frondosa]
MGQELQKRPEGHMIIDGIRSSVRDGPRLYAEPVIVSRSTYSQYFMFKTPAGGPMTLKPPAAKQEAEEKPWMAYARWSKTLGSSTPMLCLFYFAYAQICWRPGPLISLPTPGRPIIVVNTTSAAIDLLEKRKSFACRPRFPMVELLGRQNNVGFTYYGERLKRMRRALHGALNINIVNDTWISLGHPSVESNMQELIGRFTYGRNPDDEYIKVANKVMHHTGEALQPGRWMVDSIPALMWVPSWMPGAGFKRWAMRAKDLFIKMTREPFYEVKAQVARGCAKPSFIRQALDKLPASHSSDDEDVIMCAAGSLFSAGTETLSGTVLTFLILMACNQDVQERAFQEIVSAVGRDRLPGPKDRHALRFVDAVVQEVHRFNPSIPLATHSNYQEEEYCGLRIPKKTWILANIWAMMHDPIVYSDSDKFLPERFVPTNGTTPPDPRTLIFGFGRRRCPGVHFADAIVYLVVARILTLFTILPEIKDGKPCPPPLDFATTAPKPFKCRFVPRPNAEELLSTVGCGVNRKACKALQAANNRPPGADRLTPRCAEGVISDLLNNFEQCSSATRRGLRLSTSDWRQGTTAQRRRCHDEHATKQKWRKKAPLSARLARTREGYEEHTSSRWYGLGRRAHVYPPGPPAKPLLGNILTIPRNGAWTLFRRLHHEYGDLVFFHGMGNTVLVLNTMKAITGLLDRRGDIYSHRPQFTVVGELMGLNRSMPNLPYGEEWREQHKLAHLALNATAIFSKGQRTSSPTHDCETSERIILSVTYGLPIDSSSNPYVTHAEATMRMIGEAAVPGAYLCDLMPFLKYLPSWVPFQQEARRGRYMIEHLVTMPFEHVKKQMAEGTASPSLTQHLLGLEKPDMDNFERRVKWTAGSMYGAGGETTYAIILVFILVMVLYPEKQKLAQAEIDNLMGEERMPVIADLPHLPYVNAIIKETMRWHPVIPLGISRSSGQDDTYGEYFIPKGTVIVPNVWAISLEPNDKYDPQKFIPERFLDPTHTITDPASWIFGFGRRICPGKALAENSIFVVIAALLAAFDISPPEGGVTPTFGPNLVRYAIALSLPLPTLISNVNHFSFPDPFKCNIRPRSEAKAALIERRAAQCKL